MTGPGMPEPARDLRQKAEPASLGGAAAAGAYATVVLLDATVPIFLLFGALLALASAVAVVASAAAVGVLLVGTGRRAREAGDDTGGGVVPQARDGDQP